MGDVLNEVNIIDTALPIEDEVPALPSAPATPEAKANRVSGKTSFKTD